MKCVHIWSYSDPYFPAFELNTERYSVSLCIQYKCRKIRNGITPNTDTFNALKNWKDSLETRAILLILLLELEIVEVAVQGIH